MSRVRRFPADELRPFTEADLFGITLAGPRMVPWPQHQARAEVAGEYIREAKKRLELLDKRHRLLMSQGDTRAAGQLRQTIRAHQALLIKMALNLKALSIGYRYPGGELQAWPGQQLPADIAEAAACGI